MAQAPQQETNTCDSRRVTAVGGKTTDHGVNFTNTALVSRGVISLRRGNMFGQTPAKIMIPQTSHLQDNSDPQIAFLLRKQWTLYSVTPLYKFSYERLQEYSRQLSRFIASEKQKRLVVEAESNATFEVKLSSLPALKTTEQEQVAVLIQITQRPQLGTKNAGDKIVWMGCFCCSGGDDIFEAVTEDFTCLPLFLVNGAKGFSDLVETWLQKTFDCTFSCLHISPINLSWMVAMWLGCKMDNYTIATELTFSVPCTPYPLDISFAIHPKDAKALWSSIQRTQGEVRQEEVDLFMECLYKHFHRHFKIYLSATRLANVSTAVASAHSDGKIKIFHAQHLIRVLALLTELAVSKLL